MYSLLFNHIYFTLVLQYLDLEKIHNLELYLFKHFKECSSQFKVAHVKGGGGGGGEEKSQRNSERLKNGRCPHKIK